MLQHPWPDTQKATGVSLLLPLTTLAGLGGGVVVLPFGFFGVATGAFGAVKWLRVFWLHRFGFYFREP
jgi:hypothetical protein